MLVNKSRIIELNSKYFPALVQILVIKLNFPWHMVWHMVSTDQLYVKSLLKNLNTCTRLVWMGGPYIHIKQRLPMIKIDESSS